MKDNKRPWSTMKKIKLVLDVLQLMLSSFILYELLTSTDEQEDDE